MRNRPCTYCKRRRRKCISTEDSSSCLLCKQLGLDCTHQDLEQPIHDGNQQLQRWQQQINQLDIDLNALRQRTDQGLAWDLCIVNGDIQLKSRIRNLYELIRYNQATLRYLSPFEHFFRRKDIRFKGATTSIALASTGLIVRHAPPHKVPRRLVNHPYQAPTVEIMDQLIALYMERQNPFVGFIHADTFYSHYQKSDDPLSDPLALAICVDTIAYFYSQLDYPANEKRDLAEFFYVRCKDMVLDMIVDPNQRLEAVLAMNLLLPYLLDMVLAYSEARRLITIALLACHELDKEELPLIEDTMFQRARVGLEIAMCAIDVVVYDKFDFSQVSVAKIQVLDDEPKTVSVYAAMWKCILELVGSQYITHLVERVRYSILRGQTCELSLELIMAFEPTIQNWWKSLPDELRICENPFDLEAACQAIDDVISSTHLLPLAVVYALTAMIQSSLLQPYATDADQAGDQDIVSILSERALSLTLCSTQALIYVMKKNLQVDIEAMPLSFGYMMGVLHSVCNVVRCLNMQLPPHMLQMLIYCYTQLKSIVPSDHHIPASATQLESFVATHTSNPIEVYEKLPMPKLALLSDILRTCFRQLDATPVHTS